MSSLNDTRVFDRLVTQHRPDCNLLNQNQVDPVVAPDIDSIANNLKNNRSVDYLLSCRNIYEDLKRIIGQLAGLMILGRTSNRVEFIDLEQLSLCKDRWVVAHDKIRDLKVTDLEMRHKNMLIGSHKACGHILSILRDYKSSVDMDVFFDEISSYLNKAYKFLSLASFEKADMVMVDFSQACCNCGQ